MLLISSEKEEEDLGTLPSIQEVPRDKERYGKLLSPGKDRNNKVRKRKQMSYANMELYEKQQMVSVGLIGPSTSITENSDPGVINSWL